MALQKDLIPIELCHDPQEKAERMDNGPRSFAQAEKAERKAERWAPTWLRGKRWDALNAELMLERLGFADQLIFYFPELVKFPSVDFCIFFFFFQGSSSKSKNVRVLSQ